MDLTPFDHSIDERDWEMETDGTVRFALVGLGWFTRDFALPALEECAYAEATVVVSGSAEKAETVADEHDLAAGVTYGEFHDGAATDEYDAVYVGTPNAAHLEHAEAAAEYGKHVLCEKPMEANVERAAAMVEVCEDAGVELMVAYRMHTDPLMRRAREVIQSGVIGDIYQAGGACAGPFVARDGQQGWRTDPDLAGGGALYDLGVYPLNTIRFLLDDDPQSLHGTVVRDDDFLDGMDLHASFTMEFGDGVIVTCRTSYDTEMEDTISVLGTDGRLALEPAYEAGEQKTLRVAQGGEEIELTAGGDEIREEFDYFANAILADRDVGPDGEHGLFDMRVLDAIYESDETGRRVDL